MRGGVLDSLLDKEDELLDAKDVFDWEEAIEQLRLTPTAKNLRNEED